MVSIMAEKSNVPYDTISRQSVSTNSIFTKCCFCVPLRLGCFILGYLNLTLNVLQTLDILAVTAFIGLITHGFDHFDTDHPSSTSQAGLRSDAPDTQELEQKILPRIGLFLIIMLVANVIWMAINIACLVGLHKKRPGPIRVYVGFASTRLMLALLGFIYLMLANRTTPQTIVTHSIDLALTAYFILVYYIYAMQLEREREAELAQPAPVNNVFMYPTKLDKSHLVA